MAEQALLAEIERAQVREYVQHTLYRRPEDGPLPALYLTRRTRPALCDEDIYAARPGAGDVQDMREYRLKKLQAQAEAAGEEIGPASGSALEARARHGNRNMAEQQPTEQAALSAVGWKRYLQRQYRDAVLLAPLKIEHMTVVAVVEMCLSPADKQTVADLGHNLTLREAGLARRLQPAAVKKARAKAIQALVEELHAFAERGAGPRRRSA